jgi:hypothetical protein
LSLLFQQKTKGTFFFAFAEKVHRSIDNWSMVVQRIQEVIQTTSTN